MSLLKRDYDKFDLVISGKTSGDADNLRRVRTNIHSLPDEQINWIAQQDVCPSRARLSFQGEKTELLVLHRVYWVNQPDGGIDVSIEGFGCREDQYSRSKGKINAGSGIAVPMVIE